MAIVDRNGFSYIALIEKLGFNVDEGMDQVI
jgi:hypothetical protein